VAEALMHWDGCDAIIILGIMGRRHAVTWTIESARVADPDTDEKWLQTVQAAVSDYEKNLSAR
jgi:hypothetical protein